LSATQALRPARSERKARGSGHLRRAELLEAAERIFNVAGYEGATIRRIAEEVGVSSTTLYMYFEDKSQIMLEICVRVLQDLDHRYATICGEVAEPQARLRAMLEAMLDFGFGQPTAYQLLYCVVPRDVNERRQAVVSPLTERCFDHVLTAVEDAIAVGSLRPSAPPRLVAEAITAACHGAIAMRIANPLAPWTAPEALSRTLLDGLFNGFLAE
jgi:AcrR family transcriptional regulator